MNTKIVISHKHTHNDYLKDIIADLVTQRHKLNLTQEELNARIGVADRLVSKWECGLRTPNAFNLYCWAYALGLKLTTVTRFANDNIYAPPPAKTSKYAHN